MGDAIYGLVNAIIEDVWLMNELVISCLLY